MRTLLYALVACAGFLALASHAEACPLVGQQVVYQRQAVYGYTQSAPVILYQQAPTQTIIQRTEILEERRSRELFRGRSRSKQITTTKTIVR